MRGWSGTDGVPSQQGWVRVDFDQNIWIPCTPVFPDGHDRQSWAALYAGIWWEASRLPHKKKQVKDLAQTLEAMHETTYSELPCHMALIHFPDIRLAPLVVCVGVWQAEGERDAQLRALAHADEADGTQPPIVTEVTAEHLGTGLKVFFYKKMANGLASSRSGLNAFLNYAWRSEQYQTAVRLFTACPDLGRLQRAMPDIDALPQVMSFIPR
jgi:hypothetical protein